MYFVLLNINVKYEIYNFNHIKAICAFVIFVIVGDSPASTSGGASQPQRARFLNEQQSAAAAQSQLGVSRVGGGADWRAADPLRAAAAQLHDGPPQQERQSGPGHLSAYCQQREGIISLARRVPWGDWRHSKVVESTEPGGSSWTRPPHNSYTKPGPHWLTSSQPKVSRVDPKGKEGQEGRIPIFLRKEESSKCQPSPQETPTLAAEKIFCQVGNAQFCGVTQGCEAICDFRVPLQFWKSLHHLRIIHCLLSYIYRCTFTILIYWSKTNTCNLLKPDNLWKGKGA